MIQSVRKTVSGVALCVAGLGLGFHLSSNIVHSDGHEQGQNEPASLSPLRASQIATYHILQTAKDVQSSSFAEVSALPDKLDPVTMNMLRALEPAAHGQKKLTAMTGRDSGKKAANLPFSYRLHLASIASQKDVLVTIERLKDQTGPVLESEVFSHQDNTADPGSQSFTRIFAGEYTSKQQASATCELLKSRGQYCVVIALNR